MKRFSMPKMHFAVACCALAISASNGQAAPAQISAPTSLQPHSETIFYSARYYSPPGSGANSRQHLYSVATNGSQRRQLTAGRFQEEAPRISPDGRTLAFERLHDDYSVDVCTLDLATKRVKVVLPAAFKDAYISKLGWAPQSNTLAIQRDSEGNSALYLVDFSSVENRRFSGLLNWAWRPQSAQLRLTDSKNTRLFNVVSHQETKLPSALATAIWLNRDECARITNQPNLPSSDSYDASIKSVDILNLQGKIVRSVAPQKVSGLRKMGNDNAGMDGEEVEFDSRSMLMPIPRHNSDLMLVADEHTSSGGNYAFTRFNSKTGQTRFLARGRRLSWARDAKRFALVDYHDTLPYDTLPNGHKRVVYTTRLLISDSKGALRPLVSGLVLVGDCDWNR